MTTESWSWNQLGPWSANEHAVYLHTFASDFQSFQFHRSPFRISILLFPSPPLMSTHTLYQRRITKLHYTPSTGFS